VDFSDSASSGTSDSSEESDSTFSAGCFALGDFLGADAVLRDFFLVTSSSLSSLSSSGGDERSSSDGEGKRVFCRFLDFWVSVDARFAAPAAFLGGWEPFFGGGIGDDLGGGLSRASSCFA
jgi:hypothetical protein